MGEASPEVFVGGVQGVGLVVFAVFRRDEGRFKLLGPVPRHIHGKLLGGEVQLERRWKLVQIIEAHTQNLALLLFLLELVDHILNGGKLFLEILVDVGAVSRKILLGLFLHSLISAEDEVAAAVLNFSSTVAGLFLVVVVDYFWYEFLLFLVAHVSDGTFDYILQTLYFLVDFEEENIFALFFHLAEIFFYLDQPSLFLLFLSLSILFFLQLAFLLIFHVKFFILSLYF